MNESYVLIGDERLPFSPEALACCGVASGDRIDSMDVLEMLMRAEHAALNAGHAMYRAKVSSILGADK